MAPGLIEIDEARRLVLERTMPLEGEPVALDEALGRVLAEPATGVDPVPGFDNSAMDGYAVRAADTGGADADRSARLRVVDESRAGHPATAELGAGEAIAISTGAVLPVGADAVVRVEDTAQGESQVEVRVEVDPGENVRRAGEDIAAGERVLAAGATLGPAELGVLASIGRSEVVCTRRPRVSVLTSGDELQRPGEALRPGAIHNSNAHTLAALIERSGATVVGNGIVEDDRESTLQALSRSLENDLTIVSGGVSVGAHDHIRTGLLELGVEQVFWGVSLRPGKPTWFGTFSPSSAGPEPAPPNAGPSLVFGLPGNPVSAMITFLLFARPAIRAMLGSADERQRTTAVLDVEYPKQPGRAHLVRCRLELAEDGWHVRPTKDQGSHVLTSMLGADALAIVPAASGTVAAGERVEIELMRT
jgi:molybdopterin molybdotransferase